jgi:hypothetical protein
MWVIRAFVQLLERVAVGVALALALALLLALVRGGSFGHAFAVACWIVGVLAILLGASGQSAWSRNVTTLGRIPGAPAVMRTQPGDTTPSIRRSTIHVSGAALIVLAIVLG